MIPSSPEEIRLVLLSKALKWNLRLTKAGRTNGIRGRIVKADVQVYNGSNAPIFCTRSGLMSLLELDDEHFRKVVQMLCAWHVQRVSPSILEQLGLTGETLTTLATEIVMGNASSGRLARVMVTSRRAQELTLDALDDYSGRIVTHYLQESRRMTALMTGDQVAWRNLRHWLASRAHAMLQRQLTSAAAAPDPNDFAQEACVTLATRLSSYPYDAPFDAWTTRVLHNIILARFQRGRDLLDRDPAVASLDRSIKSTTPDSDSLLQLVQDPSQADALEIVALRQQIWHALEQMQSKAQRAVIIYTYFYELPDVEIGARLGKETNNVAQLRRRALQRLKQILGGVK
jgi:RNA polymerase sigma factor (sigma-70 family)